MLANVRPTLGVPVTQQYSVLAAARFGTLLLLLLLLASELIFRRCCLPACEFVFPEQCVMGAALQRERSGVVMQYRLLRGATPAPPRSRLLQFAFSPVETPFGRLRMAVDYQVRGRSQCLDCLPSIPACPLQ